MSYLVSLPRLGTFGAWREAARRLASHGVPADQVTWRMEGAAAGLFEAEAAPPPAMGPRAVTAPKAFVTLAEQVCSSRAEGAHDLLYRLLLRLQDRRGLLSNRADREVQRAEELAKNIRRDRHKMRAFVRFREVTQAGADRRAFVAWFEPDHRIEELNAPFFARRFADMDWAILTPEVTTRFVDGQVSHEACANSPPALEDETEALWKTYYANIFNPARLKVQAMQSEMPKKYWKNMPEAALIPGMIAEAEARVQQMAEAAPTLPPMRADRILARLHAQSGAEETDLNACRRCPLGQMATQAVPGEGPQDAALMIVGEQPGDAEDLAGRPFVGPAGQLLDQLAAEAGLDRAGAYVTNAVKHFKFRPQGKRRIHQSPNRSEISHCRWWLEQELEQVAPQLTLALGATAAEALTGTGRDLMRRRGRIEPGLHGGPVLITLHPAAALRARDPQMRAQMEAALRADLATAAQATGLHLSAPSRP